MLRQARTGRYRMTVFCGSFHEMHDKVTTQWGEYYRLSAVRVSIFHPIIYSTDFDKI